MKKVFSVVGARPNFMKVAPLHRAFAASGQVAHSIVHTGQHYDAAMSDAFFADLEMPTPQYFLGIGSGSHAEQTARVMVEFEKVCLADRPDLVIVVGDVNSTIACTLTAAKLGIRTAHVEAGLRSFDRSMPEELNRLATDSISDILFVTEHSGIVNLRHEGHSENNVFLVGNTMIDSLHFALPKSEASTVLQNHDLVPQQYALVTLHRPSNVDTAEQLGSLLDMLVRVSQTLPIVFPVHPRTRKNIEVLGLSQVLQGAPNLRLIEPQGYVSFLALMKGARFVLTDSGGVQEETTVLGVPCITARTSTERPVTVELGTNIMVKPMASEIELSIQQVLRGATKEWTVPPLWDGKASERIVTVVENILRDTP